MYVSQIIISMKMKMKMVIIISFVFMVENAMMNVVVTGQPNEDMFACRGGDFKSNSIQQNRDSAINKLLASFRNSSYHGFYHSQVGQKSEEQVSASLLCPPNIGVDLCRCCVKSVIPFLLKKCPKQNEGVAWDAFPYLHCMVRYSTGRKIIAVLDDWAWHRLPDVNFVKTGDLQKTLDSLTSKLKEQAAGGDAYRKYATGKLNYDRDELVLYVSAQCTPDLSKENCNKCLSKATTEMRNCCSGKPLFSGRVLSINCFLRYWHVNFFDPPPEIDKDHYCA